LAKRRISSRPAEVAYVPRTWPPELDNKKSGGNRFNFLNKRKVTQKTFKNGFCVFLYAK
jgi:hypothetical protein